MQKGVKMKNITLNKKILRWSVFLGLILSALFSYTVYAKKNSKQSCTITIKVYDQSICVSQYMNSCTQHMKDPSNGLYSSDVLWRNYCQAMGMTTKIVSDGINDNLSDKKWSDVLAGNDLEAGKIAFGYNQKDVISSPKVNGGYGEFSAKITPASYSSYSFTFPDSKNVQLVIGAYDKSGNNRGSIVGRIKFVEEKAYSEDGSIEYLDKSWEAVDWYRKTAKNKAYETGNLIITQNSDSSTLEITNAGKGKSANNTTIEVYVSKLPIDIDLGNAKDVSRTTINGDGILKGTSDQNDGSKNPGKNKSGTADKYNVQTTYKTQTEVFNNWKVVQSYVNSLIDTIEILSNAYFGFAFITCILMLIINIVAVAGAVNNPMFRTRIFLRIGVSVLCMALLGASYLLTRLFILTCMGT